VQHSALISTPASFTILRRLLIFLYSLHFTQLDAKVTNLEVFNFKSWHVDEKSLVRSLRKTV
jgi:hypothetical protein